MKHLFFFKPRNNENYMQIGIFIILIKDFVNVDHASPRKYTTPCVISHLTFVSDFHYFLMAWLAELTQFDSGQFP